MKRTITKSNTFLAITVDEAKLWCRIDADNGDDDDLVEGLIRAATDAAEANTNRAIAPATVEYEVPHSKRFEIWTAPLTAITKLESEDCNGVRTEIESEGNYWVRLHDAGAIITLTNRFTERLYATCTVGYANAAQVPHAIKQAIAVHVGSAYEGREGQDTAQTTFENLLRPYKVGMI